MSYGGQRQQGFGGGYQDRRERRPSFDHPGTLQQGEPDVYTRDRSFENYLHPYHQESHDFIPRESPEQLRKRLRQDSPTYGRTSRDGSDRTRWRGRFGGGQRFGGGDWKEDDDWRREAGGDRGGRRGWRRGGNRGRFFRQQQQPYHKSGYGRKENDALEDDEMLGIGNIQDADEMNTDFYFAGDQVESDDDRIENEGRERESHNWKGRDREAKKVIPAKKGRADEGDKPVPLVCPHCLYKTSDSFKDYETHLESTEHQAGMKKKFMDVLELIIEVRTKQINWSKSLARDRSSSSSNFCRVCQLHYTSSKHFTAYEHRKIHELLRPTCTICDVHHFHSGMNYQEHLSEIDHIKREAESRGVKISAKDDLEGGKGVKRNKPSNSNEQPAKDDDLMIVLDEMFIEDDEMRNRMKEAEKEGARDAEKESEVDDQTVIEKVVESMEEDKPETQTSSPAPDEKKEVQKEPDGDESSMPNEVKLTEDNSSNHSDKLKDVETGIVNMTEDKSEPNQTEHESQSNEVLDTMAGKKTGSEHCKLVKVYYCNLCKLHVGRAKKAVEVHCTSKDHLQRVMWEINTKHWNEDDDNDDSDEQNSCMQGKFKL